VSEPILFQGDCLQVLEELEPESVDAVITDPPYGIGFMGREWDTFRPEAARKRKELGFRRAPDPDTTNPNLRGRKRSPSISSSQIEYDMSAKGLHRFEAWCREWARACFRVLKPGGYLIAFGAPRAYHRLACGIEDAGFEVRDALDWITGTGFPKSVDGEREVARALCELEGRHFLRKLPKEAPAGAQPAERRRYLLDGDHICPSTELSRQFLGIGSALKPSHEPICLARKPFQGTLGVNLVTFGTGGLHVEACRLGQAPEVYERVRLETRSGKPTDVEAGRWPPNLLLSHLPECQPAGELLVRNQAGGITGEEPSARTGHVYEGLPSRQARAPYGVEGRERVEGWLCAPGCPVAILDAQSGQSETPASVTRGVSTGTTFRITTAERQEGVPCYGDAGGASRFFPVFRYEPKPDRPERDLGCADLPTRTGAEATASADGAARLESPRTGAGRTGGVRNFHPTVKPLSLMRWLIRLVAAPGQTVLDPFLGSGTTGMAAKLEGVAFIGVEREAEYLAIAHRRIAAVEQPAILALSEDAMDAWDPDAEQLGLYAGESSQADDLPCGTASEPERSTP